MNRCIESKGGNEWFHGKVVLGSCFTLLVSAVVASAAFTETFQDDIVGAPPTPSWIISGTNGGTATANVAVELGTSQFLALRDFNDGGNVTTDRSDSGGGLFETSGYLQFDIRFNQGVDSAFGITLLASKSGVCGSCYNPVVLDFFHNSNNTNTPLLFRAWGNGSGFPPEDPNAFGLVTSDFPIGTWQTVRVQFESSGGLPRGTYSVMWNGITNNYMYRNQNDLTFNSAPLALDRLSISTSGTTTSVDFDNILFIPEPGAMVLVAAAVLLLKRQR